MVLKVVRVTIHIFIHIHIHILYEALYKLSYQYVPFYESATGRPVTCSQIKDLGVLTQ